MKIPRVPHPWTVNPRQAIAIQRRLAAAVAAVAPRAPFRLVAGVDAAFGAAGTYCVAGAVLWDVERRVVVERRFARRKLTFPYVPGLLSFREAPAVLAALRKLRNDPDALICDGHGLSHPRRFGLACHVGLLTGLPTLGCAKSRLVGRHAEPAWRRGSRRSVRHGNEVVGVVLRTRDGVRPVYVSVGHRIDLPSAARLVLRCAVGYRLPEPTRLADHLVGALERGSVRVSPAVGSSHATKA